MPADQPRHDFPKTSAPAERALLNAGITNLAQLATYSEKEIAALHGMGPKALRILSEALAAKGLSFADKK
jgi:predicted flap endonuclease-1-like 5' DNA nuclease